MSRQVVPIFLFVTRWAVALALIALGLLLDLVSPFGIPFLLLGGALLFCPWIIKTSSKDFQLGPRNAGSLARDAKRLGVAIAAGLVLLGGGLTLEADGRRGTGSATALIGLGLVTAATVIAIRRAWTGQGADRRPKL